MAINAPGSTECCRVVTLVMQRMDITISYFSQIWNPLCPPRVHASGNIRSQKFKEYFKFLRNFKLMAYK